MNVMSENPLSTVPLAGGGRPSSSRGNEDGHYRSKYRHKFDHDQDQGEVVNNRIYVGGLGDCIGERDLFHFFAKFGQVEHVGVITIGGYTKGYGFVTFRSTEVVNRILNNPEKKNLVLKGRTLCVGPARQRSSTYWNRGQGQEYGSVEPCQEDSNSNEGKEVAEIDVAVGSAPPVGSSQQSTSDGSTTTTPCHNSPPVYYSQEASSAVPYPMASFPPYYQQYQQVPAAYPYNAGMAYYPAYQYQDQLQGQYYPYQDSSNHVAPMPYYPMQQATMYAPINYCGVNMLQQYYVNTEEVSPWFPPVMQSPQDQTQGYQEGYHSSSYSLPPPVPVDEAAYQDPHHTFAASQGSGITQAACSLDISNHGDSGFQDSSSLECGNNNMAFSNQSQNINHAMTQDGQSQGQSDAGHSNSQGPRNVKIPLASDQSRGPRNTRDIQQRHEAKPKSSVESRAPQDDNYVVNKDYGRGARMTTLPYRNFPSYPRNPPPPRQFPFSQNNPRPWYQQRGRGRMWGPNNASGISGNVRWNVAKRKPGKKGVVNEGKKGFGKEEVKGPGLAGNQPDILQGPLEKLEIK